MEDEGIRRNSATTGPSRSFIREEDSRTSQASSSSEAPYAELLHRGRRIPREARFNERAPPRHLFGSQKSDADSDAVSDADSVVSEFQDKDASSSASLILETPPSQRPVKSHDETQAHRAFAPEPARRFHSDDLPVQPMSPSLPSSHPAALLQKEMARQVKESGKKEMELPALPLQGRPAASQPRHNTSPSAAPSSSQVADAWASQAPRTGKDIPVNASTAGEWVSRLQALQEVSKAHAECSRNIFAHAEKLCGEAATLDSKAKAKLMDGINADIDSSREMLARHAQGLISTDLADLRVLKVESKKLSDRLERMKKQYTKELTSLREILRMPQPARTEAFSKVTQNVKNEYDPFLYMEADGRSATITVLQEKMKALLARRPEMRDKLNRVEMMRLEDLFKKDLVSSLEKRVAKLNEQNVEARQTMAILEAKNNQLSRKVDAVSSTGSALSRGQVFSSSSSGEFEEVRERQATLRQQELHPVPDPAEPAGRPKAGRPRRPLTLQRQSSQRSEVSEDSGRALRNQVK